jgi:hypothetical protein
MSEQVGVAGGNIWQPKKTTPNSKFYSLSYKISVFLIGVSICCALIITVLGFIQNANGVHVQQKDFFTKFSPYNNGWEIPIMVIIMILFTISFSFLLSFKFGWEYPATYGVPILLSSLLYVLFMLPVVFTVNTEMQDFKSWVEGQQGLSLLIDEKTITPADTLIMKSEDEKIYLVTFKTEDNKIFVADKVQQ